MSIDANKVVTINFTLKDDEGNFIWPGFGENMRVLKWILDRVHGRSYAIESPLGWMPAYRAINWEGLEEITPAVFHKLMAVDREKWKQEILSHEELFSKLYDKLPKEFIFMRELILSSLWRFPKNWGLVSER